MIWIGLILFAVFCGLLWMFLENLKTRLLYEDDTEIRSLKETIRGLRSQKDQLDKRLKGFNDEADKQYMLYELTDSISKSLTEEQAFQKFKDYLKEHADIRSCRLVTCGPDEDFTAKDPRTQVFYIRGEDDKNNFLIVEGVNPGETDHVAVLGHQFALVYRRLQLYSQLEQKAVTDDLTGLLTRRAILAGIRQELDRPQSNGHTAFVMIDVDHFKRFNDQHGHLVGDQILRQVAATLRASVREVDMPGRFGGEEFCVILPQTNLEGAKLTAERICKAVASQKVSIFEAEYQVTISLGVAVAPEHGTKAEDLIEHADQALYQAKSQGRNRVVLYQALS